MGTQRRNSTQRNQVTVIPETFPTSKAQTRRMNELLESIDNKWAYSESLKLSFQKGVPIFSGDPHAFSLIILIHLSTYGYENKEDWNKAAQESLENFSKELALLAGNIK